MLPTPRGKLTIPPRQVLDALLYLAKQGCTWRGLPPEFGNWHTIDMRLHRWAQAGVLERVVVELQCDQLAALELDALSLDSTIIKLHAHGMGAPRKRGAKRSGAHAAAEAASCTHWSSTGARH